jgi:hypothetical protein
LSEVEEAITEAGTPASGAGDHATARVAPPPGAASTFRRRPDAETLFAAAVIAASFFVALLWAAIIPFNEAPDEFDHFADARFIAEHNRFPVFDSEDDFVRTTCYSPRGPCYTSYAVFPGLNYAVSAGFMKVQHALTGGAYQDLHVAARLTSTFSIPVYVFFLWLTARLLLHQRLARATALLAGAFIPQVSFIGGYVNSDAFSIAAGAAVVYLTVRILVQGPFPRMALYAGLALGLLAWARPNFVLLVIPFSVVWAYAMLSVWRKDTPRQAIRYSIAAVGLALLIGSWWYLRNLHLYGDAFGLSTMKEAFDALAPLRQTRADQGDTFTNLIFVDPVWWRSTFRSFFGVFGYMSVFLSDRIYLAIRFVLIAAGAGLVIALYKAFSTYGRRLWGWGESWAWLLLALTLAGAVLMSAWTSLYNDFQPQGRYLYPALVPAILLAAQGLHSLWDNRIYQQTVPIFVGGGLVLLNLHSLLFVLVPLYYK